VYYNNNSDLFLDVFYWRTTSETLNNSVLFQEISSDGLTLVPDLFYTVFYNALWFIIAGQRFPIKEHDKLRYFTRQALRFQKSIDVTGNAVAQTPWIRHFAPYYCGFKDLVETTVNMLQYMKVIMLLTASEECHKFLNKCLQFPT
jgi:hypothetical protein